MSVQKMGHGFGRLVEEKGPKPGYDMGRWVLILVSMLSPGTQVRRTSTESQCLRLRDPLDVG